MGGVITFENLTEEVMNKYNVKDKSVVSEDAEDNMLVLKVYVLKTNDGDDICKDVKTAIFYIKLYLKILEDKIEEDVKQSVFNQWKNSGTININTNSCYEDDVDDSYEEVYRNTIEKLVILKFLAGFGDYFENRNSFVSKCDEIDNVLSDFEYNIKAIKTSELVYELKNFKTYDSRNLKLEDIEGLKND